MTTKEVTSLERFYAWVSITTVFILFLVIKDFAPAIRDFLQQHRLDLQLGSFSISELLLSVAGSFTIYKVLYHTLTGLWNRGWLKRKFLTHAYIEGTWVGFYRRQNGTNDETYFAVDHYKQPIGYVGISGKGYFPDKTAAAEWESLSSYFADNTSQGGSVSLEFLCDVGLQGARAAKAHQTNAVTKLTFSTDGKNSTAQQFANGETTNLIDGKKFEVHLKKISDRFLTPERQFDKAMDYYDKYFSR